MAKAVIALVDVSPTCNVQVVMAYIMKSQEGLSPAQALALLRKSHPAAFPNAGVPSCHSLKDCSDLVL
jgi:hypothetical protein